MMNVLDAAIKILSEAGKPLHVNEIAERSIKSGLWTSEGKTPGATFGARIYSDIKKNGGQSPFVRVTAGNFSLKNAKRSVVEDDYPAKESKTKNERNSNTSKEKYTFLEAAYEVLDHFGNRNPMHYQEITRNALEFGWLNTSGETPAATMNSQLVTEIKSAKSLGETGRFLRTSPGYYSLVNWKASGLSDEISNHNIKIKEKLLQQLMKIEPIQLENLIGNLLTEMGFESIEVSQIARDGGIDVRGTLLISDVIRIKMAVQVKRLQSKISAPTVQQVRGSLGVHEQGLIITTSDFSGPAISEANIRDKSPVGLMNGEQLVTLLMEYNIGVGRISHDLFELDELPI